MSTVEKEIAQGNLHHSNILIQTHIKLDTLYFSL